MYEITPVDNFFFRSAVPFESAGETSLVGSIFPPMPSAYAGAVREHAVSRRIRIGFNGIKLGNDFCFPKPSDLIPYERDQNSYCSTMVIEPSPLSSFPLPCYLREQAVSEGKTKTKDDLYMTYGAMQSYLNHNIDEYECFSLSSHIIFEPKIGIAIDGKKHKVKDEHLYQIKMLRPQCGLKLVADIKNINIEKDTIVKLGGESKMAKIYSVDSGLTIGSAVRESSFFKLYLATPAIFKNGWLPAWIDPVNMTGRFSYKDKSVRVQLITAAIGKRVLAGGFGYDLVGANPTEKDKKRKYKPREMRYAVPAGSVYYFKLLEGSFQNAVTLFNQKCISDYREDYGFEYPPLQYNRIKYCDRGFGYAIVGSLNKNQEEMLQCIM